MEVNSSCVFAEVGVAGEDEGSPSCTMVQTSKDGLFKTSKGLNRGPLKSDPATIVRSPVEIESYVVDWLECR